jgi:hypothetical protein
MGDELKGIKATERRTLKCSMVTAQIRRVERWQESAKVHN